MVARLSEPDRHEQGQRQLHPGKGTVLHADEAIVDSHSQIAQRRVFRLAFTWIPDSA